MIPRLGETSVWVAPVVSFRIGIYSKSFKKKVEDCYLKILEETGSIGYQILHLKSFFLSINLKYFMAALFIFKANKLVSNVPKREQDTSPIKL